MGKKRKDESSSSEDEACLEALKEAADQEYLKTLIPVEQDKNSETTVNNSNLNKANNKCKLQQLDLDPYQNNQLSQSCRDFVAKKLNERLDKDILLEDKTAPNRKKKKNLNEEAGIKLFSSSNICITKVDDTNDHKDHSLGKKPDIVFNEKANVKKCKEVAVDTNSILSQQDTKHWTKRKLSKEFRYKKLKCGTFMEIK